MLPPRKVLTTLVFLSALSDAVLGEPVLADALAEVPRLGRLDLTAPAGIRPFLVDGLVRAGRTVLLVTATGREAEELTAEIGSLVDPAAVALYPSWETLPHERLSPRSDTVGRRLAVLRRLRHPVSTGSTTGAGIGPLRVVVAPVRSILQPQVSGLGDLEPVELVVGQTADLDEVSRRLADAAYTRVDLVEKRGEFAVRGGLVDVFPPTEQHPIRVEFWGDDVEEVRSFAVADQRTIDKADRLWAPPCRELLLTDDVRRRAAALGEKHPQLAEMTTKMAAGIAVEGMESLAPALVDHLELLVDVMPADTQVVVVDPERVRSRAHDLVATSEEFLGASWAAAAGGGQAPIDLGAASYRELDDVRAHAREIGLPWWTVSPFGLDDELLGGEGRTVAASAVEGYRGDFERAVTDLRGWLAAGHRVVVSHPGHGPAQRMVEVLAEHDVAARLVEPDADVPLETGIVTVTCATLAHGFVDDDLGLALVTGDDLSGQRGATRDASRMPTRRKRQIDPLELKKGDYVVHEQHGVGRFVEMRQREVHGATREYLVLEYGASGHI